MATSIFRDLSGYADRVGKLFQLDAALLSIETKQNLWIAAISAALLASAAFTALFGAAFLLGAIVLFLIQLGVLPSVAALIVALVLFLVAGLLAFIGLARMKRWSLTPRRTLIQFRKNIEALRASLHNEQRTER
jgi:Putative Actinobacterial Holin-X, holin superfamily III